MTPIAKTLLALALAAGAGTAGATHVAVTGSHHDFGSAFAVDAGAYDLGVDADVEDATTMPHASLIQWSAGPFDYYKVSVAADSTLRLDMDYTDGFDHGGIGFDSQLGLWKADGTLVATNDDDPRPWGFPNPLNADPGSSSTSDSWMELAHLTAGTYVIGVANWSASAQAGGWAAGGEIPAGSQYQLNVSVSAVPEPAMLAQLGFGLVALGGAAWRRRGGGARGRAPYRERRFPCAPSARS